MADEFAGQDVLILTNSGDLGAFVIIGSQRNAVIEESNTEIDFSSKNQRAGKFGYGRYSATLRLDHLFVPTDASLSYLKAAARDATVVKVRRQHKGVATEEADAIITTTTENFPDNAEALVNLTMRIASAWAPVAP